MVDMDIRATLDDLQDAFDDNEWRSAISNARGAFHRLTGGGEAVVNPGQATPQGQGDTPAPQEIPSQAAPDAPGLASQLAENAATANPTKPDNISDEVWATLAPEQRAALSPGTAAEEPAEDVAEGTAPPVTDLRGQEAGGDAEALPPTDPA